MALFRFTLVLFIINHRFDQILRTIALNDQYSLKIISRKKFEFGVKLQIWGVLWEDSGNFMLVFAFEDEEPVDKISARYADSGRRN